VRVGEKPGEVIISSDSRRQSREWIRTVLVGSDGGLVFAMLKQTIASSFDDRMVISVPDIEAVDQVWERMQKERPSLERVAANTVRELAKLNPQGHVHASELYAAINIVRRTPPGPLLALLSSRSMFVHLGDMHYRLIESERTA
jgi:N12 class adenine-specific DNA methylase